MFKNQLHFIKNRLYIIKNRQNPIFFHLTCVLKISKFKTFYNLLIHNSLKIRCYYLATLSHGDPILNHMIYTNFLIERKINKSLHPKYFFKKLILYNYIQCYLIKIMPKLLYFKNSKCYEIKKSVAS